MMLRYGMFGAGTCHMDTIQYNTTHYATYFEAIQVGYNSLFGKMRRKPFELPKALVLSRNQLFEF